MSYEIFRKRIDTARQILVGAVPSPAGQIDQITYALIYKFMNDIDDQSAALGGKRSYFAGDYEQYNWHRLMDRSLGAHERLELYRQAIQTMSKNPGLPELFREIYLNAFLPFNSPNVLDLFLKEIDKFSHSESDDIGDAYEYLLSITGAQGDVGQFRTPRHIISFIVDVVNPSKNDSILDPAAGTAGFLIAAYNHVRAQHDGVDEAGNSNDEERLTSSELDTLHRNYHGFDIDPTMVRTARVNMYLHGFTTPNIVNHDSLSSEDFWDKRYDVILANPPFMTPKGGIHPHKKFSINASKAEVLFTDYIANHLKPNGRAGFVIPEGVLANVDSGRTSVRKSLIEKGLYCIVSLPPGVFSPYSPTTQTSIVLVDNRYKGDDILYIKVNNDGYSLGLDRHAISKNDLPEALNIIQAFVTGGHIIPNNLDAFAIKTETLLNHDPGVRLDYNKVSTLSKRQDNDNTVELQSIFTIEKGKLQSTKNTPGDYTFVTASQELSSHNIYTHDQEAIIFAAGASGSLGRTHRLSGKFIASDLVYILTPINPKATNIDYYYHYLRLNRDRIVDQLKKGSNKKAINKGDLGKLGVPDPSPEKQDEINDIIHQKQKEIEAIHLQMRELEQSAADLLADQKMAIDEGLDG